QVVELVVCRFHGGFPDRAFLLLAVAHDAVRLMALAVEARGKRDAYGEAEALSERAGGYFDPRQLEPVRMPLERRAEFAQRRNLMWRIKAGKGKAKIEAGRFVSGGPDDAVPFRPGWISGIMFGDLKIQRRGDVHDRKRPAAMPGSGSMQRDQVVPAHEVGSL